MLQDVTRVNLYRALIGKTAQNADVIDSIRRDGLQRVNIAESGELDIAASEMEPIRCSKLFQTVFKRRFIRFGNRSKTPQNVPDGIPLLDCRNAFYQRLHHTPPFAFLFE